MIRELSEDSRKHFPILTNRVPVPNCPLSNSLGPATSKRKSEQTHSENLRMRPRRISHKIPLFRPSTVKIPCLVPRAPCLVSRSSCLVSSDFLHLKQPVVTVNRAKLGMSRFRRCCVHVTEQNKKMISLFDYFHSGQLFWQLVKISRQTKRSFNYYVVCFL